MPADSLPDFLELHTFVVAARWMHLTQAAAELHVTQGAVSQRIKQLELRLGTALFVRTGRELQLTAEGQQVLHKAQALLAQRASLFSTGAAGEDRQATRRVIINTTPSVACGWLLPRLPLLARDLPEIALQVSCSQSFTRFRDSHAEIAIRFGAGQWPQVDALPLMDEWIFAACSPQLDSAALPRGTDWSGTRLLEDVDDSWARWLPAGHGAPPPVLRFNDSLVLMEACAQGLGIALLRHRVAAGLLAQGRLRPLGGPARRARFSYWLVTPQQDSLSLAAREARNRVADWLRAEAGRAAPPAEEPWNGLPAQPS